MVFDEGEAACPQYVVVGPLNPPVEVGQSKLVIVHGTVADTVGGPRRELALPQVAGQHLGGSGAWSRPTAKRHSFHQEAVDPLHKLLHNWSSADSDFVRLSTSTLTSNQLIDL